MKCAIIYSSITGNTKKVAETILKVAPAGTDIYPVENAPSPDNYDILILGYWVDKGMADERILKYIEEVENKKLGIFGTSGSPGGTIYSERIKEKVKNAFAEKNDVFVNFLCQGQIDPALTEKLYKRLEENPENEDLKIQIESHRESSNHPNEVDLKDAEEIFKKAFELIIE